ncbi:MAG: helix-turn-helix domain-containing protein [Candidatus Omnitrophota bacterium]
MGVTHKLKQDVINFIIDQKRDNPKFGCRELAELTSEKFKIKVSKSSVNSIIKSTNLSNSVGRPSKKIEEKNKKFQIPSEKKQQISKELHKIPLPKDTNSVKTKNEFLSNQNSTGSGVSLTEQKAVLIKNAVDVSLSQINIKYAGLIFLKLAFLENLEEGFLGTLMQAYNTDHNKEVYDKFCNSVFMYVALDIIQENRDLNLFLSITDQIKDLSITTQILDEEIKMNTRLSMISKLELELDQLLSQVGGFLIRLENKKAIKLNANLTELIGADTVIKSFFPLKTSLDKLSNFIINNTHPLIMVDHLSEDIFSNDFFDLMGALEGVDGYKIEEICVIGTKDADNILASFSFIPQFRRKFAFGVFENNINFTKITKASQWAPKECFKVWSCKEAILYTTTKTDYFNKKVDGLKGDLTVLTVWKGENLAPLFAIITNLKEGYNYVISRYLEKIGESKVDFSPEKSILTAHAQKEQDLADFCHLKDIYMKVYNFLRTYMICHYFKIDDSYDIENNILIEIYKICGTVDFQENELIFTLDIKESAPLFCLINDAMKVLNNRDVLDSFGRCVKIRV